MGHSRLRRRKVGIGTDTGKRRQHVKAETEASNFYTTQIGVIEDNTASIQVGMKQIIALRMGNTDPPLRTSIDIDTICPRPSFRRLIDVHRCYEQLPLLLPDLLKGTVSRPTIHCSVSGSCRLHSCYLENT